MTKKQWRKPEVKSIAAGSAENGPGKNQSRQRQRQHDFVIVAGEAQAIR